MPTTLEDRDEILQLMYRYNHLIDSGDAEGWADTFADGAVFEAAGQAMTGRDVLVGFASSVHGLRHMVTNPVIEINADTAQVQAYLVVFSSGAILVTGAYADQLVRTPAGWRFAKRVFTPDPPATT